jgi:hypothetical protein
MSANRTNKNMLAARVLCTLLLGTYLVGGYGEPVAWGGPMIQGPTADATGSITASAWGDGKASEVYSTAWGVKTIASGDTSTAFGGNTIASGTNATAWGTGYMDGDKVTASGYSSTAFGVQSIAEGSGATAWGGYVVSSSGRVYNKGGTASGDASTAFGIETTASSRAATAFGYKTTASGFEATAFGSETVASGHNATAFGIGTKASVDTSTAFGRLSEATAYGATAWGGYWTSSSDNEKGGKASGKAATAFGVGSSATTKGSTAWGYYSVAGSESINDTNYSGDFATAFGRNSYALGNYSTAIGDKSMTTAENSLAAIGGKIIETAATNSAAIGMDAWVTVKETVALGSKSVASRDNVTDTTKYTGYNPLTGKSGTENTDNSGAAWVATRNAIAVGDADKGITRQITGVAAGTDDTDAVNVAQLKAMAAASVYTAADGITVDTDKKISIKANTDDFKFESGTLNLTKNGKVEYGNEGVVTGGKVYDALQAQSTTTQTALEGKTNVALDNINDAGKTVVRNLAKESVKVVAGTNTTVTEGTDGNAKTYAVDVVTNGAVASGDTGIVTGGTVFTETRVAADANYIKASNSAAENLGALDTQVKANTDAIGTTTDGTYVKSSDSVGENLNTLDTELAALAGGTGAGLSEVNHRIDNLDSKTNKVGAGAAALAALHPMDTDGKFGLALGYGNYRSANAMAMGLFYRPTDRVMFSIGGSMGNGENLMNVGVSFALDKGVTTSKAAMARTIKAQAEKIQSLEARLAALEAKLGK